MRNDLGGHTVFESHSGARSSRSPFPATSSGTVTLLDLGREKQLLLLNRGCCSASICDGGKVSTCFHQDCRSRYSEAHTQERQHLQKLGVNVD